jgi:hypothetical protein
VLLSGEIDTLLAQPLTEPACWPLTRTFGLLAPNRMSAQSTWGSCYRIVTYLQASHELRRRGSEEELIFRLGVSVESAKGHGRSWILDALRAARPEFSECRRSPSPGHSSLERQMASIARETRIFRSRRNTPGSGISVSPGSMENPRRKA